MNARAYMIVDHRQHKIITRDVSFCQYNETYDRYDVRFGGGKQFSYNASRLSVLINPTAVNPAHYRFVYDGKELYNIEAAYAFHDVRNKYWHICFGNGYEQSFFDSDLQVSRSCLLDPNCKNVFEYLKQVAACVSIKADDGTKLLEKQYERAGAYIDDTSAATSYLNPSKYVAPMKKDAAPIFPFGCNASQYTAVKAALDNPTSVIQGPPGTGKTQTILNIIANLLIDGKTVQVVSNNNAATANVREKLSSPKYEMGFLVASLGSVKNKTQFLASQTGMYPDISSWQEGSLNQPVLKEAIRELSVRLQELYQAQECLATLRQELQTVVLEKQYFDQYMIETADKTYLFRMRRKVTSDKVMQLWQQLQLMSERQTKPTPWFKIKNAFVYGIFDNRFYQTDTTAPIHYLQERYYQMRVEELEKEIHGIEKMLAQQNIKQLSDQLTAQSMTLLRGVLFKKYGNKVVRPKFTEEDLWKHYQGVQTEYPIVLSTTFSARSSLCRDAVFDYVIMDEASQVDVATGALALTCAKRAVIVGDTKQLPNVVTDDIAKRTDAIFESFSVCESYRFSKKSFLQSLCELLPLVPQTLLREHYRCHPKIIGFCNQAFYDGQLLVMTEDHGEADVLSVVKTVAGDHARDHMNQRQVDAVTEEILPCIEVPAEDIGIIAPYNNQVQTLQKAVAGQEIEVATVHKFQGREKDTIILTTVDNEVTDFSDDPYLLNVAVSRAKKKLCVVVSGNEQPTDSNIANLVAYIEYNNFQVAQSNVYSVFDYLYHQNATARAEFLKKQKNISEYDSENLMFVLIKDVLEELQLRQLGVACHVPLNMLIRDLKMLEPDECRYVMNNATHVDFLIYNRLSKKPLLVIEVDGYHYHKEGTIQHERDQKKNHILQLYQLPLIRFVTNGSGEKEKLIKALSAFA